LGRGEPWFAPAIGADEIFSMARAPTGQKRTQMVQYVHFSWNTWRSTPNMSKARSGQVPTQPAQEMHLSRSKSRILFGFLRVGGWDMGCQEGD
jgi:hypothetical protein